MAARAKPGELTYASAGSGTLPHLSAERFSRLAGIRLLQVPYKGVAAALPDLMAGRANVAFGTIGTRPPVTTCSNSTVAIAKPIQ